MQVNRNLFVIPDGENFILYVPSEGIVQRVSPGTIGLLNDIQRGGDGRNHLEIAERLFRARVLVDEQPKREKAKEKEYRPTSVTLFPTNGCNLRCIYCYGSAGESELKQMPIEIAETAIEFVIKNATKRKGPLETLVDLVDASLYQKFPTIFGPTERKIRVGFHGAGEPFHNFKFVKMATLYAQRRAREMGLRLSLTAGTNGVLSEEKVEWIVSNLTQVTLSLDGPEDIQNRHRPTKKGTPSFDQVIRTIEYFEKHGFKYGLRPTITADSVDRMVEIYRFFSSISSLTEFHFEPAFECGRCEKTQTHAPDYGDFLREFLRIKEIALREGKDVYYSGGQLDGLRDSFCGAAGKNFFVTPNGEITTCLEVASSTDPRSDIFFIGQIKNGKVELLPERIKYLRSRTIDNLDYCTDCFAVNTCAGDCLAKVESSGGMFNLGNNPRCGTNQAILLYNIKSKLKE